jgi:hypothetical protein
MSALIQNQRGGRGSCEDCDDSGYVTVEGRVIDGIRYEHWAAPCSLCERGPAHLTRAANRRESWRDREDAA